jgi:predicted Zn-dependent protease
MKRDSSSTEARGTDSANVAGNQLALALQQAENQAESDQAWDALEAAASDAQSPDEVAALYHKLIRRDLGAAGVTRLGRRALRFFEEWFAGDTDRMVELLNHVLVADPEADWALERLSLVLSVQQRWDELLQAYDKALSGLADGPRRRLFLHEAAQVAADSGALDRAAGYLQALFAAAPTADDVAATLERTLERLGQWQTLAEVLAKRIPLLSGSEADLVRQRLAHLYFDKLGQADKALDEIARILRGGLVGDDSALCVLAERILNAAEVDKPIRQKALDLLRARHHQQSRPDRVVAALRAALAFADADERRALAREAADTLFHKGDPAAAREQTVELLGLEPDEPALRARLKYLAEVTQAPEAYGRGLLAAAEATQDAGLRVSLWLEAAQIKDTDDSAEALTLYRRVADDQAARPAQVLAALRRLAVLLADEEHAAERLAVLERQAALETVPGVRRGLLGEAARLASSRGEIDRALKLWETRLAADPEDRKALAAVIDLLSGAERWAELVIALRRRVATGVPDVQRRADLMRVALIERERLGQADKAITALQEVLALCPDDREGTATLTDLFAECERWPELVDLGGAAASREDGRLVDVLVRLGDVSRSKIGDGKAAVGFYGRALGNNPASTEARAGLWALLEDGITRMGALQALLRAFTVTDDWRGLLQLLPHRLALADHDRDRADLQAEAARLQEQRAGNTEQALEHMAAALRLAPEDGRLESETLRLAGLVSGWTAAVESLAAAAAASPEASPRSVHLRLEQARVLDEKLADKTNALAAAQMALRGAPDSRDARLMVARLAAQTGAWPQAAEAALAEPFSPDLLMGKLLPTLEKMAAAAPEPSAAYRQLGLALSAALANRPTLPAAFARLIEERAADYPTDDPDWANQTLVRATDRDPTYLPTLQHLARAQKAQGGRPLVQTLMKIATLAPRDLDVTIEAADLAQKLQDPELGRGSLALLFDRSAQLLRLGLAAEGQSTPLQGLLRAVEGLVSMLLATGDSADAHRALEVLLDAARLPLPRQELHDLRARAGQLALQVDKTVAREIYRRIVDEEPRNREAIDALARLFEEAELHSELLALRRRTLELERAPEQRLAARLEISRVAELIEGRTGRFEALLSNLEEQPGHPATIEALTSLMHARSRHAELADILSGQARKLEAAEETAAAVRVWSQVAALAESPLADSARAITAYERIATLEGSPAALEALARHYTSCGEPLMAAQWLEQRIAVGTPSDRRQSAAALARAYQAAGQGHRAVAVLERVLAEDGSADELWALLADLYRDGQRWEALVRVLSERAHRAEDSTVAAACAREAVHLCAEKLKAPERALPALERAVALVPTDRSLRLALADALRITGRVAEARTILERLIEEHGRRQSRERALLHHQAGLAARTEGNLAQARDHLEQAAAVLIDHADVQLALAEVAEQMGDKERAEKAYRSLLVLARRGQDEDAITAGEVLLRLRRVALALGRTDSAAESLESAIGRAMHSPSEARRVQAALLADGEKGTLLDLLAKRRAAVAHGAEEATVVCELAEALDKLGQTDEGFAEVLKLLEKVPDSTPAHTLARALATKLGQPARYLDAVTKATDQLRRADDVARLSELLLRAADAAEKDVHDRARATALFRRAEQVGVRAADALSGLARLAAAAGDEAEQRRVVGQLRRLAGLAASKPEKADLLYRLAECQLDQAETRAEGLQVLAQAIDLAADLTRATALVQAAQVPDAELASVMPVYEKVARGSGDERVLLDFLERRATLPNARMDDLREAVELAHSLGEDARAEALLARAVDVARTTVGVREALWAVLDLVRRLRSRGDVVAAARVLEDAREAWSNPRLAPVVRDMARAAAERPDTANVAARLLEHLRTLYPTDREVWEPLLRLHANLNNRPALEALAQELGAKLMGRSDRNAVRMTWAGYLMNQGAGEEATAVLRDVLTEEPGHPEALGLLADLYEKNGNVGEAVALLSEALSSGEGAAAGAGRITLTRRLANLLRQADPEQAKQIYRATLAGPIEDAAIRRELQASLAELLSADSEQAERAAVLEDLLADETGPQAAKHALRLAELRSRLEDETGTRRALEMGRSKCPEDAEIFQHLGQLYMDRQMWPEVVALLGTEAARQTDLAKKAKVLRGAARIQRERIHDEPGAAETLRQAVAATPDDLDVLRELTGTLLSAGDSVAAVAAVGTAMEGSQPATRPALLHLRAELHTGREDHSAAAADLEEALALGDATATAALIEALTRVAAAASAAGDVATARQSTLRLADVLRGSGDVARADQLLFHWIDVNPEDREVLHNMRDRFEAEQRWDAAANVWARLVHTEEGQAKAHAVLSMTDACEKLGRGGEAIPWLQGVLSGMPEERQLQHRLAGLLQTNGQVVDAARMYIQMADGEADEDQRHALWVQAAQTLAGAGEWAETVVALEKATTLRPTDRASRALLVDACLAAGNLDRAGEVLNGLLAEPKSLRSEELAALFQRQAHLAAAAGDGASQLMSLKKAMETDRKNLSIANEVADLAEAAGDNELAMRALRVLAASPIKDAKAIGMAYFRQGRIAHKMREKARAIIFLKRALQEDPEQAEARQLLDTLK